MPSGNSALSNGGDINLAFQKSLDRQYQMNDKMKYIEFKDIWEKFEVNFSINLPADDM